jgi:hypothetical protein
MAARAFDPCTSPRHRQIAETRFDEVDPTTGEVLHHTIRVFRVSGRNDEPPANEWQSVAAGKMLLQHRILAAEPSDIPETD